MGDVGGTTRSTPPPDNPNPPAMPYVNIQITREGATPEQKRRLIAGVTRLLSEVLNKSPLTTHVVIQEIDLDSWGVGGLPVVEFRRTQRDQNNV